MMLNKVKFFKVNIPLDSRIVHKLIETEAFKNIKLGSQVRLKNFIQH